MQIPKGILIAIGGAEDKGSEERRNFRSNIDFFKEGILKQITDFAGKRNEPKIEIITTASSIPDEVAQLYRKAFKQLGLESAHLKISTRDEADLPKNIERLQRCNCLLFSGGDQLKLCSVLGGTDFIDIVRERYLEDHFIIAGTSAGAAAMSNTMISGGEEDKAYMKGRVDLSIGFGFLQEVIIDTHFDARGRFGRLVQAIARQPGALGIGLDEDTGVIVEKGTSLKAIGSSSIIVVDGSAITHNNIAAIKDGSPISIANLQVNILTKSDTYDLTTRKFMPAKS
jgi:cyanophycinase